ncbi:MAG: hypothetical protein ACC662_03950, partial [Planctomycetota bacterium]
GMKLTWRQQTLYLQRPFALGVRGVKVSASYPLLDPGYPRADEYAAFYRRVARLVRKRGMTLLVGTGAMFTNPEFSNVRPDYTHLTLRTYRAGRRRVIERILREMAPDYLTVANEPSTAAKITGIAALDDPVRRGAFVRLLIRGLDRGRTKIGAGAGTWEDPAHLGIVARMEGLDYLDVHVYPVLRGFLDRTFPAARLARDHGKSFVIGEAWLYKASVAEMRHGMTWSEIFRRDAFSCWESSDARFVLALTRFARSQGVSFLSFFWSRYFFGSLDASDPTVARQGAAACLRLANAAAVKNLLAGRASSLGRRYAEIIAQASGPARAGSPRPPESR